MLRRAAVVLALLFAALYAYAPLAAVGFLGSDLRTVVEAGRLAWPESGGAVRIADLYGIHGVGERPLAAGALLLLARVLAEGGRWTGAEASVLRQVDLGLLLVGALVVARVVRRALGPWTGSESARAAGRASAALLVLHPLSVSVVAAPARIGDLLGLALAAAAGVLFLHGRQERRAWLVGLAVVPAILCGLACDLAFPLALLLALCELTSARRPRPLAVRLRTAGTTLAVFAAAASVELVLRLAVGAPVRPPGIAETFVAQGGSSLAHSLAVAVEKLGILIMPVHPHGGLGAIGYVLAGAALLLAIEPGLVAARSAPRLWGWLLVIASGALVLAELSIDARRVPPETFAGAEILFPAVIVIATALGTCSTALSGMRRRVLPIAVAAAYAVLAHEAAKPYRPAADALAELRAELESARAAHGRDARVLVAVESPETSLGIDVLGGEAGILLDRALTGETGEPEIRGLTVAALMALAREPEFDELRRSPLILLFPGGRSLRVPPPADPADAVIWRGEARSPLLDLDPFHSGAVRVTARADAPTAEPPVLAWRARSELAPSSSAEGVWLGGDESPIAFFDLGRRMEWLLGGRIARLWLEGDLTSLVSAEVLGPLPSIAGAAHVREGDDWLFACDAAALPRALGAEVGWRLTLLDLATCAEVEIALAGEARELRFPGAAAWTERVLGRGDGPVAWSLAYEAGNTALARASGRLHR